MRDHEKPKTRLDQRDLNQLDAHQLTGEPGRRSRIKEEGHEALSAGW